MRFQNFQPLTCTPSNAQPLIKHRYFVDMKSNIPLIRPLVLTLLVLASFVTTTLAQEVQIPDPGLNAAIREALEQPNGPLTSRTFSV